MTMKEIPKAQTSGDSEVRFSVGMVKAMESTRQGEGDDPFLHLQGQPIVFGRECVLYPKEWTGFDYDIREVLEPGCLDGCDMTDVVLNINHGDGNYGIARTRNGTLRLSVEPGGVTMEADLRKENARCAQAYEDVREGLLDSMSFRFIIKEQDYDEESHLIRVRKISRIRDVSLVEFPAYPQTSVSALRSSMLDGIRERAEALQTLARKRKEIRDTISKALDGR